MRVQLIANPVSGRGRSRRLVACVTDLLRSGGHRTEVFWSRGPGDARENAGRLGSGVDRILVVGGDGTLNEVLNGLADPTRRPIAQLATGTANILAHELALPRDPEGVARMVSAGPVRRLDMGLAGERRFLMVASAGFDAMVTRRIALSRTATLGYLGYAAPILGALREYEPPRISVRVDDRPAIEGQLVLVSNTRNYGGLFTMADLARCDSGRLDVCVLRDGSLGGLARTAAAGLTGGLSRRDDVEYLTGRRIRIDSSQRVPVQIDGDHVGQTPIDIGLRPAHVPVVVPAA
jgi:YegS/Rv2252/BmrU family lipid kinase